MHVSTLRALIHLCNLHGSLVINMNSSTSTYLCDFSLQVKIIVYAPSKFKSYFP
jgi:hypothetical protein